MLGLGSAWIIYSIACRYWNRTSGYLGAAIFLVSPLVMMELSAALVDLGVTFFFLLSLYLVLEWSESKNHDYRVLIVAGIFGGMTAGIKYQGVMSLVSLGVAVLILILISKNKQSTERKSRVISLLSFLVPAFLVILPWLVKNVIITGNPVYPNLYSIFGGKDWSAELASNMSKWLGSMGMGKSPLDFLALPWRITMRGYYFYETFAGIITPFFFFPLPLLLFIRKSRKIAIILLIIGLVNLFLWFLGSQQVRFLLPGLAVCALLSGVAIGETSKRFIRASQGRNITTIIILFLICATAIISEPKDFWLLENRIFVVFSDTDESEYLQYQSGIDNHKMIEYINENLPQDSKILMLFDNRTLYLERPWIVDGTFEVSRICTAFAEAKSMESLHKKWRDMGVTHILFNKTYWSGYSGDFIRKFHPGFARKFQKYQEAFLEQEKELKDILLFSLKPD
jgi:hypothetical protein